MRAKRLKIAAFDEPIDRLLLDVMANERERLAFGRTLFSRLDDRRRAAPERFPAAVAQRAAACEPRGWKERPD